MTSQLDSVRAVDLLTACAASAHTGDSPERDRRQRLRTALPDICPISARYLPASARQPVAVSDTPSRRILLHVDAPGKPEPGQPCNGCGVCCSWQPCPLGMLLSLRRHGACRMLRWQDDERRYVCGLLQPATRSLPQASPEPARARAPHRRALAALWRRWIGAGRGCDCTLQTEKPISQPVD